MSKKKHWHARIFGYSDSGYAGDRGDEKSITGYYNFVGGNLVTWRSKKKDVSRSSTETEYRAMAHMACEIVWLKNLQMELGFRQLGLMSMHCETLRRILYYMKEPNTLIMTVILSEMLRQKRWLRSSSYRLQSS